MPPRSSTPRSQCATYARCANRSARQSSTSRRWQSWSRSARFRGTFTVQEARQVGEQVGIDWDAAPFEVEQFRRGLDVELEHGLHDPSTNVTDDDLLLTGKIALAHLNEFADYYTRLEQMEEEAKRELP